MTNNVLRTLMQNYPITRGRSRLTRSLSSWFSISPGTIVSFDQDLQIELCEEQFVSRQIYWFGIFEPVEAEFFKATVKPGMTVIDVGGNIGQYTLLAAKRVGADGHVHTFEPASRNHGIIERNIQCNGFQERVTLNKMAMTSQREQGFLVIAEDGGSNWVATGESDKKRAIEEIPCDTLDGYLEDHHIKKVDVIKIDAEGCDFEVLKGSVKTLQQQSPILFVEFAERVLKKFGATSKDMLNFVTGLGYQPYVMTKSGLQPLPSDTDLSRDINLLLKK